MEVVLSQFVKSLTKSGLMTSQQVEAFIEKLPPEKKPEDGKTLAQELVRHKKLTKFQAQAVYQGKTKGLTLGDYVVLDRIGQGGMGQVFKARHKVMKRVVALKTLPAAATNSERAVQRFHREVEVAARLSHPNIVTAHDAGESHGLHYLVMEHVDGDDLATVVKQRGRLTVKTVIDYILQAAKGLEYAHKQKVIHRDIKPSNLLLDREGTVKVLDMGLARLNQTMGPDQSEQETLTGTGQVMGTIDFMPPEQAENTKQADERSDIYSLGCTLYYLLTGEAIYHGDTTVMKILAHRETEIPSLRRELPEVSEQLDAIYQKMVAKKPDDRYGSMAEVIAELEKCASPPEEIPETATFEGITPRGKLAGDQTLDLNMPVISPVDEFRKARPKKAKKVKLEKKHIIFGSIAVGVLLILGLLGVVFSMQTPEGTLIVEVNQANAEISVDDGKVTLKSPSDSEPVEVEVAEGKHTLKITKGGFHTFAREFEITSGGEEVIRVTLVPLEKEVVAKPKPTPTPKSVTASSSGGNWALEFDGKDDWVQIPKLDYDGTYPITIEAYAKPAIGMGSGAVIHTRGCLLDRSDSDPAYWQLMIVTSSGTYIKGGKEQERQRRDHVAGIFDGNTLRVWVNGREHTSSITLIGHNGESRKQPSDEAISGKIRYQKDCGFLIGATKTHDHETDRRFHGTIDEVRISNIARYTKDFTPQRRFEPDKHTMALYHFDGGSGDVLKDSSGNGHDGKIVGAKWVKVDEGVEVDEEHPIAGGKVESVKPLRTLEGPGKEAQCVAFSPDGSLLACSGKRIILWDTSSWVVTKPLNHPDGGWYPSVSFSPDGASLAAAHSDTTGEFMIGLWDVTTGEPRWHLPSGHESWGCVASAPDGSFLASTGTEPQVKLWDVNTRQVQDTLRSQQTEVRDIAFSPDGSLLACGNLKGSWPELWDVATAKLHSALKDPECEEALQTYDITFSPDGRMLATAHQWFTGAVVRIWDVESGEVRHRLQGEGDHSGSALAFSPDGALLAYRFHIGRIKLWNPNTGEEVITFDAHEDQVRDIAFSPDGRLLASACKDNTVKIWEVSRLLPSRTTSLPVNAGTLRKLEGLGSDTIYLSDIWVSKDGKRLYYSDGLKTYVTSRDGQGSPFQEPKVLLEAGHLTLTADERRIMYRSPSKSKDLLFEATRPAIDKPFEEPMHTLDVSSFDKRLGAAKCPHLSTNGLSLFFQVKVDYKAQLYRSRRDSLDAPWQAPELMQLKVLQEEQQLTNPFLTDDGRTLICTSEGELGNQLVFARRSSEEEPFGGFQAITTRDGKPLYGRAPFYVDGTGELFFLAMEPTKSFESSEELPNLNIWVLEGFSLDSAGMDGAPPLVIAPFTPEEAKQHQQAWADHLGVPVEFTNSIGMKMVLIPPGEFMMGSSEEEIEEVWKLMSEDLKRDGRKGISDSMFKILQFAVPQHKVRITKPFYFAAHEVTVGQFRAFVEKTAYKTLAEIDPEIVGQGCVLENWKKSKEFNWRNIGVEQTDQHPVVNVNREDINAFCQWITEQEGGQYTLPTEAQWEYACRAGTTTACFWGDLSADREDYVWWHDNSQQLAQPVGKKLPNAFGLFDILGNVSESCLDGHISDYYRNSPISDPLAPPSGDGWSARSVEVKWNFYMVRSATRTRAHAAGVLGGFRPVLLIDPNNPPKITPKLPTEASKP